MTARIDDELRLSVSTAGARQDRAYSASRVASVLDANRGAARTTQVASYLTTTSPASVYYTALNPNGSVLTSRRTSGVSYNSAVALWEFTQSIVGVTDFVAVWDEGDPAVFTSEWIVVDS